MIRITTSMEETTMPTTRRGRRSTKKKPDEALKHIQKDTKERIAKACIAGRGVRLSAAETRALYPHWAGPRL